MIRILTGFVVVWTGLMVQAQPLHPPVGHTMVMTGDFGELRPDHFHAGIDLRSSRGVAGDAVLAAGRGYIFRISIHHDGYGHALWIRHTDGRQTLYAHLDRFAPAIQAWVDTIRYARQEEEVDLVLDRTLFPVERGQTIGYMGTTGFSSGVHLHFEVRDPTGHVALDPLTAGIHILDKTPPELRGIKVYVLDDKLLTLHETKVSLTKRKGIYRVEGDTLLVWGWRAGLGIAASDLIDGTRFRTGIRQILIEVDSDTVYQFHVDAIDLRNTRYINAHLDYPEWIQGGGYYHRCHALPGNRLDMYPMLKRAGLITLSRHEARQVRVTVADKAGHTAHLRFWMRRDAAMREPPPRMYQFRIPFGEGFLYEDNHIRWEIPSGSLYETTFLQYTLAESEVGQMIYKLHQPETPLHQPMRISLPVNGRQRTMAQKLAVVREWQGKRYLYPAVVSNHWLQIETRHFGDYSLYVDTLPPLIDTVHVPQHWTRGKPFLIHLTDDVEPPPGERNLFWKVSVNGRWIAPRWNTRDQTLAIDPSPYLQDGANQLTVTTWDRMGNQRQWAHAFQYTP